MKVLITGACGFVARGLIKQLEERGHQLVLLDRINPEDATIFWPWAAEGRIKLPLVTTWPYVKAEILDFETLLATMQGINAVIHLAAAVSGDVEQGIATMHANVCGTYTILDAARRSGIARVLCASSVNVFGTFYWRVSKKPIEYPSLPLDETFEPIHEDPYSLSKQCNELTCAMFARGYGMTTAALRFAGVWAGEGYDRARSAPGRMTSTSGSTWTTSSPAFGRRSKNPIFLRMEPTRSAPPTRGAPKTPWTSSPSSSPNSPPNSPPHCPAARPCFLSAKPRKPLATLRNIGWETNEIECHPCNQPPKLFAKTSQP